MMGMSAPIRISVLADGRLLLDDQVASLDVITDRLRAAADDDVVWYYRENATGDPPPEAMEVMKAITARRLPVRLSSKPDFSDSVRPATAGMETVFAPIRAKAARGNVVILRPNGQYLVFPVLKREQATAEAIAAVERILPSSSPRKIAVVAETNWTMNAPTIKAASEAIPFFGLLMGLATIGHAVWIVGPSTDLAGACREADVLIVDSGSAATLPEGWPNRARQVMSGRQILEHDRATYRLREMR